MSAIEIQDAGWKAIMADERLAGARRKLSFHELRLIINHARAASVDTRPEGGDGTKIAAPSETSGAVGEAETPKGGSHAPNH